MCTAVSYHTKDHYFGRNLDFECSYGESVTITPRRFLFCLPEGAEFRTKYAMIGMAHVAEGTPLYYDVVNEKGLAMAGLLMGGSGCASNKADRSAPELPARHWLDDAPGIPIENKAKYDAAVPDLYKPNKKFGYEDCVYLTIQQSPALVNSAVDIEIKRVAQTSAAWKYLPEPHMTLTVSQNLTMKNMDTRDTEGEYGKTQIEVGFYAPFPNPVATYFEHKAQGMMTGIAIATHRKAVGEAIYKIAEAYLSLQAKQYSLAAQKSLIPVARELTDYWRQMESVAGSQGANLSMSQQHVRENELAVEKATMEETLQRTQLKMLAGVEASQKFEVDASHAYQDILKGFDGKNLSWENRWNETEDNLILRTQIQLADFNIMLQWAQYVPNMSFSVNMNPPRGQSQPANGSPDEFLHFTFDFPLIDWGRRYRDVQTARMGKAQAFHSLAQKRSEYQNKWLEAEQNVNLALTNLKLAQNRYKTAQMQYDEARIRPSSPRLPTVRKRWCSSRLTTSTPSSNTAWPNSSGCTWPACFRNTSSVCLRCSTRSSCVLNAEPRETVHSGSRATARPLPFGSLLTPASLFSAVIPPKRPLPVRMRAQQPALLPGSPPRKRPERLPAPSAGSARPSFLLFRKELRPPVPKRTPQFRIPETGPWAAPLRTSRPVLPSNLSQDGYHAEKYI